jgi:hypothetical protein
VTVPDEIRDRLKAELWHVADEIDWLLLGPVEKTQRYENWAQDPKFGGVLSRYMDVRHIRQYIKDTLLKKYPQSRHADSIKPMRLLELDPAAPFIKSFIRPHGRQLSDGRTVSWGRAADWKSVLLATHERAFQIKNAIPYGIVLLQASRKFGTSESRAVVIDAASKLGLKKVVWNA